MKKLILLFTIVFAVIVIFALTPYGPWSAISPSDIRQYQEDKVKIPASTKEGITPGGHITANVYHVVDGDTIDVKYKSRKYTVRFLDIDTPESVKPGVDVQPFAKEASAVTEKMVMGKNVNLIFEKGLKDRYGRLLAFVVTADGVYLNAMLVGEGYARVEIVSPNNAYSDYFEKLQDGAIAAREGMWGLPPGKQPFVKDGDGEYIPSY